MRTFVLAARGIQPGFQTDFWTAVAQEGQSTGWSVD